MEPENVVNVLVENDHLNEEEAETVITEVDTTGENVLDLLTEQGVAERKEILEMFAHNYGMEFFDLEGYDPDQELLDVVDSSTAQQYFVFPLEQTTSGLKFAIAEPPDIRFTDDLEAILDQPLEFVLTDPELLEELITQHYGASLDDIDEVLDDLGEDDMEYVDDSAVDEDEEIAQLEEQAEEAPVIKLVNQVIMDAVEQGTSDIHIEPLEDRLRIRYRIDGVCHESHEPPKRLQGAIISRIKIMSDMDIAERRVPQDGRIKMKMMGKELDFRVNTLPGIHGESVVLRILDKESVQLGLGEIGFKPDNKAQFDQLIRRPNGIILVTGPTGSGKTTTLYSALQEINTPDRKLITIENPVEYQIEGINQMQVNEEIGLDFAMGLKSLLRQSPDVILVGEIRDFETAEIAIRAALTGHLVFSTLHTNDAPSAINRLIDLGVNPYLISSSIQSIMAQRLVRTICENCREEYDPEMEYIERVGFPKDEVEETTFYRGAGCEECDDTGYSGRTAIFEMMISNEELKRMILEGAATNDIRDQAMQDGMRTLREDGFITVKLGETTLMEVARVTQAHGTAAAV
jgi:type IV pilus assembly protein PilB